VRACGLCHYPNGKGRPENAGVSGQTEAYILQQLDDFKNGNRMTSDYRKGNTGIMASIAEAMTPEEMKTAAKYFSSIKFTPWVTVKEAAMVPTTRIAGGLFLSKDDGMMEPIGNRIIEVPENTENTETLRDPHSGFIAYVPVGSIKKGEALVTTGGNGKTIACATCHGQDLRGLGPVPAIAGRSPSYLVRQMFDMQAKNRNGLWTPLMKDVVAKLTDDDMLQIAAYVASKQP
jgi:cytochrome c553